MFKTISKNILSVVVILSLTFSTFFFTPQKTEAGITNLAKQVTVCLGAALLGIGTAYLIDIVAGIQVVGSGSGNQGASASGSAGDLLGGLGKECIMDPAIQYVKNELIVWMTKEITGQTIPNPNDVDPTAGYVQDFEKFFMSTLDNIAGKVIYNNKYTSFLCDGFAPLIKANLNISLYQPKLGRLDVNRGGALNPARCSLSKIVKDAQFNFNNLKNRIKYSGWNGFADVMVNTSSNNIFDVNFNYEFDVRRTIHSENQSKEKDVNRGHGFFSIKQCQDVKSGDGDSSVTKRECKTTTPGNLVQQQLDQVLQGPLKGLQLADEFDEIFTVLASALANAIFGEEGLSEVKESIEKEEANPSLGNPSGTLMNRNKDAVMIKNDRTMLVEKGLSLMAQAETLKNIKEVIDYNERCWKDPKILNKKIRGSWFTGYPQIIYRHSSKQNINIDDLDKGDECARLNSESSNKCEDVSICESTLETCLEKAYTYCTESEEANGCQEGIDPEKETTCYLNYNGHSTEDNESGEEGKINPPLKKSDSEESCLSALNIKDSNNSNIPTDLELCYSSRRGLKENGCEKLLNADFYNLPSDKQLVDVKIDGRFNWINYWSTIGKFLGDEAYVYTVQFNNMFGKSTPYAPSSDLIGVAALLPEKEAWYDRRKVDNKYSPGFLTSSKNTWKVFMQPLINITNSQSSILDSGFVEKQKNHWSKVVKIQDPNDIEESTSITYRGMVAIKTKVKKDYVDTVKEIKKEVEKICFYDRNFYTKIKKWFMEADTREHKLLEKEYGEYMETDFDDNPDETTNDPSKRIRNKYERLLNGFRNTENESFRGAFQLCSAFQLSPDKDNGHTNIIKKITDESTIEKIADKYKSDTDDFVGYNLIKIPVQKIYDIDYNYKKWFDQLGLNPPKEWKNGCPAFDNINPQGTAEDWDADGVKNLEDNCPFVNNPPKKQPIFDEGGNIILDDNHSPILKFVQADRGVRIKVDGKWEWVGANDGIGDACDRDGDGISNRKDNCPLFPNPDQSDENRNGLGDACDPDVDNDKKCKEYGVNCDTDLDNYEFTGTDADGDGIKDSKDNCPNKPNKNQLDSEEGGGDGIGDVCDNCRSVNNRRQFDTDKDDIGNACDPDIDNDTYLNGDDYCPYDKDKHLKSQTENQTIFVIDESTGKKTKKTGVDVPCANYFLHKDPYINILTSGVTSGDKKQIAEVGDVDGKVVEIITSASPDEGELSENNGKVFYKASEEPGDVNITIYAKDNQDGETKSVFTIEVK